MYIRPMEEFQRVSQKKNKNSNFDLNSTLLNFEFLARENAFENMREMQFFQEKLKNSLDMIFKISKTEKLSKDQKLKILQTFNSIQKNPNTKNLNILYRIKLNLTRYFLLGKLDE